MMHAEGQRKGYGLPGRCSRMMTHGSHRCMLVCGIMLITAGSVWLASKAGWFDPELIWPVAFLAAGLAMAAFALAKGRRNRMEQKQSKEVYHDGHGG